MMQTKISFYFGGNPSPSTSQSLGEKRLPACPGASKHRKTGIDPSWMDDFPWLELGDEIGGETVMWW